MLKINQSWSLVNAVGLVVVWITSIRQYDIRSQIDIMHNIWIYQPPIQEIKNKNGVIKISYNIAGVYSIK